MKITNGKHTIEVDPVDYKELKSHGYTIVADSGQDKKDGEPVKTSEDKPEVRRGRKKAE